MEETNINPAQDAVLDEAAVAASPHLREMIQSGLVYGRVKSKTHPRMKQFVAGNRNGIELIDLEKTLALLERALDAVKDVVANGGVVLFVNTHPASRDLVETIAKETEYPFVVHRWIGGTLTNFRAIANRIATYRALKDAKGTERAMYTKKELLMRSREVERMQFLFSGIEHMSGLPQLLLVVNSGLHDTAIHEARACGVPVVAIMSTDADPDTVRYPIPANDNSREGVQWILERIRTAIEEGKRVRAASARDLSGQEQPVIQ
ncbi:MAG: 30S ribosomal protein S2 [Candidatus Liptonbacteria bacterium]|nr:30S ribosomal protein S2 [Candidatus Liptonbacteria bacterium]